MILCFTDAGMSFCFIICNVPVREFTEFMCTVYEHFKTNTI